VFDSKIGFIRRFSHRLFAQADQLKIQAEKIQAMSQPKSPSNQAQNESSQTLKPVKDEKKNPRRSAKRSALTEEPAKELNKLEVNHFHEIGWMHPDPQAKTFAGEGDCNNIVRKEFDDLVYDPDLYVTAEFAPPVVYMPNDEVLETMMKAAAAADDYDGLMYAFGIATLCCKCGEDIKPGTHDRFMWPDEKAQ